MTRVPFAFWHTILLLLLLIPPKLMKAMHLPTELSGSDLLSIVLPDLVFVIAAEAFVLALARALPRGGRLVRALWGLALLPLMSFAVTEHRFFLSSGSFLDFPVYWHGLKHARELSGVIGAELTPFWWTLMILPIPVGIFSAILGWMSRPKEGQARARSLAISGLGLAALVLLAWWSAGAMSDPRLASLKNNSYISLTLGWAEHLRESVTPSEVLDSTIELPDLVELDTTKSSQLDNVVIILLESVRADATTPYTPELDSSPFMARLAREGMFVKHGYTVIPHTTKSLVPTLCGFPPDIRQPLSETTPGAVPARCLPKLLEPLGYSTAYFQPATGSFEQRRALIDSLGYRKFVAREQLNRRRWQSPNYLGVEDRAIIKPMMSWVDQQKTPFLLTMLTLITHHNYQVPTTFKKKDYGGSERWSNYLNTIRYSDEFLEEIFREFDKRGLLDNTLFVIMGDHGEGHGEHGRKGHDELIYQEGLHIPYILWSRHLIPEPVTIEGNRQNTDLLPTLADLLNLKVTHGSFIGRSLLEPVDDRLLFAACWYEDRCLTRIDGNQKVNYYYDRRPLEVFDLEKDPKEQVNLAYQVPRDELESYIAEMKEWKRHYRQLYLSHKRKISKGFVLFEKPEPEFELDAGYGNQLDVLGFDVSELRKGKRAVLSVYFYVKKNLGWHRKFQLRMEGPGGRVQRLHARSSLEQHPMFSWIPGQYMKVEFDFRVPRHMESGGGSFRLTQVRRKHKVPVTGDDANRKGRYVEIPMFVEE